MITEEADAAHFMQILEPNEVYFAAILEVMKEKIISYATICLIDKSIN